MQIGRLKHKIDLQRKQKTKDQYGAEVVTWVTFAASVPAEKISKSGNKAVSDFEVFNSQIMEVNIRLIDGLDETVRVLLEGRLYKVNFINEPYFRSMLTLVCERIMEG